MEFVKPLGDFALVEIADDTGGVTPGGIVIPDGAGGLGDLLRGKVIARGPLNPKTKQEMFVEVNRDDEVLFSKHAGLKFKREGKNLALVMVGNIIAQIVDGE